jgi:outer membrane protein OmpA-like peptidoglycan-associated protein
LLASPYWQVAAPAPGNAPNVARSGDRQLRNARDELSRAENLLQDEAELVEIEHAAYLANRHAQNAADQARQEAEELRLQMEAMQAEQTDRGMVLTLGDVLFDLNKADLKASGENTVERLAEFMSETRLSAWASAVAALKPQVLARNTRKPAMTVPQGVSRTAGWKL